MNSYSKEKNSFGSSRRWTFQVIQTVCCLVVALFVVGCGRAKEEKKTSRIPTPKIDGDRVVFPAEAPQRASIAVQSAEPRKLAITHVTGRLYWNDDATVRVFTPVTGRVSAILSDLDAAIAVGTSLAEIDSPDYGQALADARTATANLKAAEKTFTRTKDLLDHGSSAQKDVDAAEAAYGAALAERDRSSARLALYGGSEDSGNKKYILRSPLGGILVEKNINPGQEVRADQMLANATNLFAPLFVISDPSRLWLQLDVAESDLPSLQPGLKLQVNSKAFPDKVFDGVINKIGRSLDPSTRTVKVRCVVENPERLLKAEMYVMVDVVQDTANIAQAGVEISGKAIFMKDNEYYLFIENSPGEYRRQRVKIGTEKDGKVPIMEGVAPGQKVVTEGCLLLQALVEPAG